MSSESSDLDWTVRGRLFWEFCDDHWRNVGAKEKEGSGLCVKNSISSQQHSVNLGPWRKSQHNGFEELKVLGGVGIAGTVAPARFKTRLEKESVSYLDVLPWPDTRA